MTDPHATNVQPPDATQVRSAYVDWELVERMRNAEEIDSEEAGMIGAMIDAQADEIAALRALLTHS